MATSRKYAILFCFFFYMNLPEHTDFQRNGTELAERNGERRYDKHTLAP